MKQLSLFLGLFFSSSLLGHYVPKFPETLPSRLRKTTSSVNVRKFTIDFVPCTIQPIALIECSARWDTRKVVGARDDYVEFFPRPKLFDQCCKDINKRGQFHISANPSIVGLIFTGPQQKPFLNAILATDFLGISDFFNGTLRYFYAFGRIAWDNDILVFGEVWHPLLIPECFPQTVSFAFGSPLEPRSRCPQIRYAHRNKQLQFIITAADQHNALSSGPLGPSSTYIRDALIPNINFQIKYQFGKHYAGAGVDFKRLVPRLVTDNNFAVNEHVESWITQVWAAFNFVRTSFRMKAIYAQNASEQIMISGYAVRTRDPITDFRTYAPTTCYGGWVDTSYVLASETSELGLFVGFTKNAGAAKKLYVDPATDEPIIYNIFPVINRLESVFRASPRFVWLKDPLRVGIECEATRAVYGHPDCFAKIRQGIPVTNLRLFFSLFYSF